MLGESFLTRRVSVFGRFEILLPGLVLGLSSCVIGAFLMAAHVVLVGVVAGAALLTIGVATLVLLSRRAT